MEVEIDHDLSTIIARRQPTARDLRLLLAFSRRRPIWSAWATRRARWRAWCAHHHRGRSAPVVAFTGDLRLAADLASGQLRKALDAFARLDVKMAWPS